MRTIITVGVALAMMGSGAFAQGKGRGHGNGHGRGAEEAGDYAEQGCPPGLAKKHNGCIPPGQARKAGWARGSRLPAGFNEWTRYDAIPQRYRSRVPYNQDYRYVYRDDQVYAVDPKTRLVQTVISLLGR